MIAAFQIKIIGLDAAGGGRRQLSRVFLQHLDLEGIRNRLRDLVLVPASLVAGFLSLIGSRDGQPGPQFYRLLALGKQSESWINLFGAVRNSPEAMQQDRSFGDMDIDSLVGQVEKYLVDEYHRGGVTAHAKEQIDKALDAIQRRASRRNQPP